MATLTITFNEPPGITGYIVKYRVKGTIGAYTTIFPNPTTSPVVITGLLAATEYEGTITSNCVGEFNTETDFNSCNCPTGFIKSTDGLRCEKTEELAPVVTNSGYCIAPSTNAAYSNYFARIYNPNFNNASLGLFTAPAYQVYAQMYTAGIWANPTTSSTVGPMNKAGVWIDSDCDGTKNSLITGEKTTLSFAYNNANPTKTVYVGIGGDNQFSLIVNGIIIAETGTASNENHFKIWHIIPVTLLEGTNYFNIIGTGDGSANDSIAMTIYDNTSSQLVAANSPSDLNVLFSSQELIGSTVNVSTCAAGYSLDTSGLVDKCIKVTRANCTGA